MSVHIPFRTVTMLGAFAISFAPPAAHAQTPQPATSMAHVACTSAASAMRASAAMPDPQSAKTDVDSTYKAMMAEHAHAMMEMSALERRCGSDAKMKADADASESSVQAVLNTLHIF